MARISTYPIDEPISGGDKWIGSDAQNSSATKNFTANAVAEFLNTSGIIEAQSLKYRFQAWNTGDIRNGGTISFETYQGDTVAFSGVTGFMLSYKTLANKNVFTYYTSPLKSSYVLITKAENPSDWGIYLWANSTQNILEPTFYDIDLIYISSTGSLKKDEEYFISLLQIAVGSESYIHTQSTPSSSWVVTHGLDKFASVTIVDTNDDVVFADVHYDTTNQVTISFSQAIEGKAYFN